MDYYNRMKAFGKTLAANLRRVRSERGYSLAALADRSGVAKATLANLEQGRGNPTIETVWSLAIALGVAFSDLFEQADLVDTRLVRADEGSHVLSHTDAPPLDLRLVDRIESPSGLTEIFEMTLAAGGEQQGKPHGDGVVERMFVYSGRVLAGPVDDPVELGPGDFLRYPGDRPHIYKAVDGPCRGMLIVGYPSMRR
ncbi:MAG: helix-turn-helix domain-containing protein [Streptosporangiales bacterium]|nr:helix-turn-helix domain-containing protein [Streptosporangiales bacterium]